MARTTARTTRTTKDLTPAEKAKLTKAFDRGLKGDPLWANPTSREKREWDKGFKAATTQGWSSIAYLDRLCRR